MDKRPIGVFDSGVGGLTAVKQLQKILPGEDIIYFGDTGRVPYGTRSSQTIKKYAAQAIRFLMAFGVKAVVAACGTVSANLSAGEADAVCPGIPYIDAVSPSSRAAAKQTRSGKIGVIATSASVRSGAYPREVLRHLPNAEVFSNACPLLVPLVENGMTEPGNEITRLAVKMYLEPLKKEKIDTLILGCTHFPLLYDIINTEMGQKAIIIDAGSEAAKDVYEILSSRSMLAAREKGNTQYYVTDTVEGFVSVAKNFLFEDIAGQSHYVEIESIDQPKSKLESRG